MAPPNPELLCVPTRRASSVFVHTDADAMQLWAYAYRRFLEHYIVRGERPTLSLRERHTANVPLALAGTCSPGRYYASPCYTHPAHYDPESDL